MTRFILGRVGGTIPVLVLITLLIFMLLQAAPGDPANLLVPEEATKADIDRVREEWGLNQPAYVQYGIFVWKSLHGDLGTSFRFGEPVLSLIGQRLPATLELAFLSTLLAVLIGVPLGIWAGARPNSWVDNFASLFGFFGISMPRFWMGIMLILLVSGYLGWLPTSGRITFGVGGPSITGFVLLDTALRGDWKALKDALSHIALPAITLGTNMIGIIMRVTRSSVIEIMREEYIMTARAKGQKEWIVLWRHVLKNSMIVIITVVGLELGSLLSGSIIIETVFSWPGLGSLLIEGLNARDYPLITGLVLIYTTIFVSINIMIDLCYAAIDPRLRFN